MKATYNKEKFSQIMINKVIKKQLDSLKTIIPHKKDETFSYGEVIIFLIKELMKNELKYKIKSYSVNYKTKNVSTKFIVPIKSVSYNIKN